MGLLACNSKLLLFVWSTMNVPGIMTVLAVIKTRPSIIWKCFLLTQSRREFSRFIYEMRHHLRHFIWFNGQNCKKKKAHLWPLYHLIFPPLTPPIITYWRGYINLFTSARRRVAWLQTALSLSQQLFAYECLCCSVMAFAIKLSVSHLGSITLPISLL